jgi:GrpB-like predicted nucleotidyltransferase (UPF0157 family)
MPSRYTLTEYSSDWPRQFQAEADRLISLLGDEVVTIHHVGSTSVRGLAAKPTIDLLPVVRSIAVIDRLTERLTSADYRAWGEYGLPGRRFFTRDHAGYRAHNVHVYEAGHAEIDRHVAFCAYLRQHPEACREYESLKREVYARHSADIAAYNEGKDAWIKRLEPIALDWYRHHQKSFS